MTSPYAPNVKVAQELAMERKTHGNRVDLIMKVKDKNITLYFLRHNALILNALLPLKTWPTLRKCNI